MTRTMYDSVNPYAIPRDAEMILWYNDGIWAWTAAERAMFPRATMVSCSAVGARQAQVYDVEPGCIWPIENVGPLVKRDWDQGLLPTVYLNRRNHWQAARDYFRRTYGREPQWLVAEYDGDQSIPDGAIGKQYAHPADPPGSTPSGPWELPFHADVSAVRDYWPGVDNHAPGGGETEVERMYAFDIQEVPATDGAKREAEIIWPPMGGATGVAYVWVSGQVPAGAEVEIEFAHWNAADGTRLDGTDGYNYLSDDTVIVGPAPIYGKAAPKGAAKLVLVYKSTHPLKFAVEATD